MLYTIVSPDDIFYPEQEQMKQQRLSSNPFDYVRAGYYLDDASLYGGANYVHYHCDIASHTSGNRVYYPHQ